MLPHAFCLEFTLYSQETQGGVYYILCCMLEDSWKGYSSPGLSLTLAESPFQYTYLFVQLCIKRVTLEIQTPVRNKVGRRIQYVTLLALLYQIRSTVSRATESSSFNLLVHFCELFICSVHMICNVFVKITFQRLDFIFLKNTSMPWYDCDPLECGQRAKFFLMLFLPLNHLSFWSYSAITYSFSS